MKNPKTVYVCSACGGASAKWQGQCPECEAWNTLTETTQSAQQASGTRFQNWAGAAPSQPKKLSAVKSNGKQNRLSSGLAELDRVLGGGFVDGEVVLLGGDPGIGKSTILLQTLAKISSAGNSCLYVSGEESLEQIAMRSNRLGLDSGSIEAFCEVELERILGALGSSRPRIAVIDSIQTMYSPRFASAPGSVTQVRECAAELARFAKSSGTTLVMVGHVTKDGSLAGPRVLEHIVDAVLYFEGDPQMSYRMVRPFKNRFGAIHEVGIFAMGEQGLSEVSNPSALFLVPHKKPVSGACVVASSEGSRPLLAEVQALVEDSKTPNPRRVCVGMDVNRLAMLLAILQKHDFQIADQNVFLNITGGVRINETGIDLPALLAVVSSLRGKPLPDRLVAFGEVGLTGELRPVQKGFERLHEAAKLGFKMAIIPEANLPKQKISGIEIIPADSVAEALLAIHGKS